MNICFPHAIFISSTIIWLDWFCALIFHCQVIHVRLINGNTVTPAPFKLLLKHWGEMLASQKSKFKTKHRETKQKDQRVFANLGLHSFSPLFHLMCNLALMLRFSQLTMLVLIELQIRFVCCRYPSSNISSRKEFLNLGSGFVFSGRTAGLR